MIHGSVVIQLTKRKSKKYIKYLNQLSPTNDNYVSINFGGLYFSNENARKNRPHP